MEGGCWIERTGQKQLPERLTEFDKGCRQAQAISRFNGQLFAVVDSFLDFFDLNLGLFHRQVRQANKRITSYTDTTKL